VGILRALPAGVVMLPPLQAQPPLPWQWFNWWSWPSHRHAYSTRTIWRPGFVPYRLTAWHPDIVTPTIARFNFDLGNWAAARGVPPNSVVINMNTGSVGVPSGT
jgi:hypothetical protein